MREVSEGFMAPRPLAQIFACPPACGGFVLDGDKAPVDQRFFDGVKFAFCDSRLSGDEAGGLRPPNVLRASTQRSSLA